MRQMRAPVRFTVTVGLLARDGVTTYLELGPGWVLAGLLDGCLPSGGAELLVLATGPAGPAGSASTAPCSTGNNRFSAYLATVIG